MLLAVLARSLLALHCMGAGRQQTYVLHPTLVPPARSPPLATAAWVLGVQLGTNNYFVDSVLQQEVGGPPLGRGCGSGTSLLTQWAVCMAAKRIGVPPALGLLPSGLQPHLARPSSPIPTPHPLQVCGANAFFTPADPICANQPCR